MKNTLAKKLSVLSLSLLAVTGLSARALAQTVPTRFNTSFQLIEEALAAYKKGAVDIEQLSQGSLRQTLFSTQTLADLFSEKYPELSFVQMQSKSLEDGIGNFRKTIEQLDYARNNGKPDQVIKKLESEKANRMSRLVNLIEDDAWTVVGEMGMVAQLKETVSSLNWSNDETEKADTYAMMAKELKEIDTTEWDMTTLESPNRNGIHDLRKAVRWYKLQMTELGDFVGTQNKTCAKGAVTPNQPGSGGKCLISQCLHSQMANIYDVFGSIKDQGEGHEGAGEEIDPELLVPAKDLYSRVKKEKLFTNIQYEFTQCADSIKAAQ